VGIRQWFLDLFDKEGTLSLSAVVAKTLPQRSTTRSWPSKPVLI